MAQIQRTEVNANHVLIYFEEVRVFVTLLGPGEPLEVLTSQPRFQRVYFTYTAYRITKTSGISVSHPVVFNSLQPHRLQLTKLFCPSKKFSRKEYWSGLPFPSPEESSWPRDWSWVSHIVGRFFLPSEPPGKHHIIKLPCISCMKGVGEENSYRGKWILAKSIGLIYYI